MKLPGVAVAPPRGSFDYLLTPPPPPPDRGGRPQRIRIEIEIVDRRAQAPRGGYRFGIVTLWLLVIVVLAALAGCTVAHAQPQSWSSYQQGFTRQYQGTDANGGQWSGTSYRQGFLPRLDSVL